MTKGIINILVNDSTIQALVGTKTNITDEYKVFPLVASQEDSAPYIVCTNLSKPAVPCKNERVSSFTPVVQVACYHKNYDDALALAAAVKDALDNKTAGTYNGINFTYLRYVDSSETWILGNDGVGLYVILPQFEAQINESTPT